MIFIVDIDNTIFTEQFSKTRKELSPQIINFIEENNIGDNVMLFYWASLVKELLKAKDDKKLKEAVITFMFDE